MKKVFFVCGIHGSGKTTFCDSLSKSIGIPFFSSSTIIKQEKQSVILNKEKLTPNLISNQEFLIAGVSKILQRKSQILLDGHTTLHNSEGEIVCLDYKVFSSIYVTKIFLLTTQAEEIQRRILERDGIHHPVAAIQHHILKEEEHAYYIADKLGVGLHVFRGEMTDIQNVANLILERS